MSSRVEKGAGPVLREHGLAIAFYTVLSIAISWPLARSFTTVLTGAGLDALSHLWGVWHAVQAFAGREPLFSTNLLYYPAGASLLLHSAGPLTGVLALPFWPLGPVAGYNGGLLVGLTLTGVAMYVLAREIGCSHPAALFAGVLLLAAPVHLVGLRGHLAKVFLGLMPIAFVLARRALDARRSIWWVAAFAFVVLLLLLHSPFQFVQVVLTAPLFAIAALRATGDRRECLQRTLVLAVAAAIAAGPLVIATARAAAEPAMLIDRSSESASHQPDVVQFVLPPSFSLFFGTQTETTLARWGVTPEIETEVSVPWTAVILIGVALVTRAKGTSVWVALAAGAVVLSLGPTLQAFGQSRSVLGLDVPLPYSWVTALPGLDFLRTPPRFMQVGFVGIAAAAGLGLARIGTRWPAGQWPVAAIAALVLLGEVWPSAWPGRALPPVPAFYQRLAGDAASYGVLDLPVRPLPETSPQDYSAMHQTFQMVHRKGIAGGYLSRTYERHPISPCVFADDRAPGDVRVNGAPSRCEPAAIYQLASHGYRYLVWHRPSEATPDNLPGSWAEADAQSFVAAAFGQRPPTVDEPLVRVWELPRAADALPPEPVIELGRGWYPAEPLWRWASSPASITITAPRAAEAELVLTIPLLHDRNTGLALGKASVLMLTAGHQTVSVAIGAGQVARLPLALVAGAQEISLALGAGNFRPSDYGEADDRLLSFAVESIELQEKGSGVIFR